MMQKLILIIISLTICLTGCKDRAWNDPYSARNNDTNTYYTSFSEQPKTLDPARSYSSDETLFIAQIYEPILQYHYLKRPYTLVPLTAAAMPQISYLDRQGKLLPNNSSPEKVAYSVYTIKIKPHIFYQPHPAFAKKTNGEFYYQHLTKNDLTNINTINDFKYTGTRELTADDYVYEIKRLADPRIQSSIDGLLDKYIVGFAEFGDAVKQAITAHPKQFIDLRTIPMPGLKVIDPYTYQITIKGIYPQLLYWLAVPFFAPIPWEADYFYSQPGMAAKNLSFAWYPVGTGPYLLKENNPNSQMILVRNPNFHEEYYPSEGEPQDKQLGWLNSAGKRLPFINQVVFTLEKESIPRWNKFLQGYYDQSTVSSDSFEQAVNLLPNGEAVLTPTLQQRNIHLQVSTTPSIIYTGFNMLDPVVGGYSARARNLRHALAIAINSEEYITIFLNGRATVAQTPLPPAIFGYQTSEFNPDVYDEVNGKPQRKSIEEAKQLLTKAGYANGIDPKTGKPLLLYYDVMGGGTADDKAMYDWLRKQFAKLNIQLEIRDTQYNRFQEKVRNGQAQIFVWGWNADYPDPENFFFLLYGPNDKVKHDGENATNYHNPQFDKLFEQMRDLPNSPQRQKIIDQMVNIYQQDSPWINAYFPDSFVLTHSWILSRKPNVMANNTLKYISLDPKMRAEYREKWNQPIIWPLVVLFLLMIIGSAGLYYFYWQRQHKK